jgi:hypothetical protein
MKTTLPEPLSLPWELRPVSSARSGFETLADGRRKFWVDEFLKGINPKMLVWWFSHPRRSALPMAAAGRINRSQSAAPNLRIHRPKPTLQ